MFRSLHTSSSVVQIKSTVNIQIIRVCYNVTVSLNGLSSNGLLSTADIRSLEKCYKKREKAVLDITLLKKCRTFNAFPKFIHIDIPFSNRYDVTYIKVSLLKFVLHKRDKEKKKLDAELTRKTQ